jgi:hypothetical protein
MPNCFSALFSWSARRWIVAAIAATSTYLVVGLPTAVIENPVFGRAVDVTPWSIPVLVITSVLSGLLVASYFRNDVVTPEEKSIKIGGVGAILSYLAVGCPVCNKLVLIALGSTGAIKFFAPVQPYLAWLGVFLLAFAVQQRLSKESSCQIIFPKNSEFKESTDMEIK